VGAGARFLRKPRPCGQNSHSLRRNSRCGADFLAAFALAARQRLGAEPVRIGFSLAKTELFAATAWRSSMRTTLARSGERAVRCRQAPGVSRLVGTTIILDRQHGEDTKLITDDKVDLLLSPLGAPSHFAVVQCSKSSLPMVGNTASVLVRGSRSRTSGSSRLHARPTYPRRRRWLYSRRSAASRSSAASCRR
jgi:hypothetical protein